MEEGVVVELTGYEVGLFAAAVVVSWHVVIVVRFGVVVSLFASVGELCSWTMTFFSEELLADFLRHLSQIHLEAVLHF